MTSYTATTIEAPSLLKAAGIPQTIDLKRQAPGALPHRALEVALHERTVLWVRPLHGGHATTAADGLIRPAIPEKRLRRLVETAWRAMYALGMDGARVVLWDAGLRGVIQKVEPEHDGATAFRPTGRGDAKDGTIRLGADVEWLIVSGPGKILPASHFFSYRGPIGTDRQAVSTTDRRRVIRPIAELRPSAAVDEAMLFRAIGALLERAHRTVREAYRGDVQFWAGAAPVGRMTLGAHFHVSGIPLNHQLLRAWDEYLALPLFCLEDRSGRVRRPKYGFLGDVRVKRHGGFEYRTLPSLLVEPSLLEGAILLFAAVARHAAVLPIVAARDPEVVYAYYTGDDARVCPAAAAALARLSRMVAGDGPFEGDPARRRLLRAIHALVERLQSGWRWVERQDIMAAWTGWNAVV
ncbi:MAG: hypothetical protein IMW86_03875 [Hydrogenibacillus sp.]|nr:hypothetical protein [Hydrogenibacillus sp.]